MSTCSLGDAIVASFDNMVGDVGRDLSDAHQSLQGRIHLSDDGCLGHTTRWHGDGNLLTVRNHLPLR